MPVRASLARRSRLVSRLEVRGFAPAFGTDEVAPRDPKSYLKVYELYAPLLAQLSPEAREKLLKGNYERLFDEARRRVRAWEKAHAASSGR
jgi:hypothetical protein